MKYKTILRSTSNTVLSACRGQVRTGQMQAKNLSGNFLKMFFRGSLSLFAGMLTLLALSCSFLPDDGNDDGGDGSNDGGNTTPITMTFFDDVVKTGLVAKLNIDNEESDAIINSEIYAGSSGSSIEVDLLQDGSGAGSWGGVYLKSESGLDLSDYSKVSVDINTSNLDATVDFIEFKLEDAAGNEQKINLFELTHSATDGDWKTYTALLSQFSDIDFSKFTAIGFWTPKAGEVYKPGPFYVDNIVFTGEKTTVPNDNLVWSDEFNGTSIDSANWTYDIGTGAEKGLNGWGNNEWQYYTNRPENARIEDFPGGGRGLVIEAKKESYGGSEYTSARLLTQGLQSFTYGRIEARIKLPIGQGIWPAFWMLGSNIDTVPWPGCGEIDIMEYLGHEPTKVHGTIHFGGSKTSSHSLGSGNFNDDFHVFAIEWEAGEFRWYVDEMHYATQTEWTSSVGAFPSPFDKPFFILLNVAVGGNWPGYPDGSTVFPQKMYVDWVRVYRQ